MKKLFLFVILFISINGFSHSNVKIKSLKEALKLYNSTNVHLNNLKMKQINKYILAIKTGKTENFTFYLFKIKGQYGPIVGLFTLDIKNGNILSLQIMSYTKHGNTQINNINFLNQFKNLKFKEKYNIKFLENEEKTKIAIKEVLLLISTIKK